jgi:hypothetical protein
MPNPFGGNWDNLTSSEYYRMNADNRYEYHHSMSSFYYREIKQAVTPRKAGQAPPATDDQIRGLRELYRFHTRQAARIRKGLKKENYYSLDEEKNRTMMKPTYDAVERMPHTTKEMYDNFTREDKLLYWGRLLDRLRTEYGNNHPKAKMAARMRYRMRTNPNYTPPFEGDETPTIEYNAQNRQDESNDYDNFTDEEKRKYHWRISSRAKRANKIDESNFHRKMVRRITRNSPLPTYPTPEAEKEAEEE